MLNYAVIDRDGFFRDVTQVWSAHRTPEAAIREAKRHRVTLPGGKPCQSTAMVIKGASFTRGEKIYRDEIRRTYKVIW